MLHMLYYFLSLAPALAGGSTYTLDTPDSEPRRETIYAAAKKTDGNLAYTEQHDISYTEKGEAIEARTEYFTPEKKLAAILSSNFKNSLPVSDYTFTDLRDGSTHGVEVKQDGYLVWKQEKNEKREEKLFKKDDFKDSDLVTAGQGLFFFLKKNLKEFSKDKSTPVKLLIPGRLDYFSFRLTVEEEDAEKVTFKMRADSLIVRIFLSSLRFQFNKETNQVVKYYGPSNLVESGGSLHNVEISYETAQKPIQLSAAEEK